MPRGSARELVDRLLYEQLEHLSGKWEEFKGGDETAALTDLEVNFLLSIRKLEQDAEFQDVASKHLARLSDSEVEMTIMRLEASLPELEGP